MFELMGKKVIKILRKYNFLIWTYAILTYVLVFRNNSYHKDGHYSLSFGSSGGIQDYHEGHVVHVEVPVDRLFYPQYYQRLGIPA